MKRSAKESSRLRPHRAALGLGLLVPLLMGGCPEFRNDLVAAFETATTSALFGTEDAETIGRTMRQSVADAAIDLLFDQLRADSR